MTPNVRLVDPHIAREGSREWVQVAVGVLLRPTDQAFLLTSRPQGKAYAGHSEFPRQTRSR